MDVQTEAAEAWTPPDDWLVIRSVDAHTAGEPFRVITSGFPEVPGRTMLERRRHMRDHLDALRTALVWEPRGHADMYAGVVTPPVSAQADLGILFMHNDGYSTMCGHGIIGMATVALETGMLPGKEPMTELTIDTPAGLVRARAAFENGRVKSVRFTNVPSFVIELDARTDVPGLGAVEYDLAFGGAFYAFVQAASVGVGLSRQDFGDLVAKGMAIKRAVMASRRVAHPFEDDLSFLYGTVFIGPAHSAQAHSRNVCIFAEGEVDRCPTGTGVSARLAIDHARGELSAGESIAIESILDTQFRGRILGTTDVGTYEAVIPEVQGSAHITGRHEFLIGPDDPLREGFILR